MHNAAPHDDATFTTAQPVTIEYVPGQVRMFQLTQEKVESLAGCGDNLGIYLTFFGISVGALISWGPILWLNPPADPTHKAEVLALTIVSACFTALFLMLGGNALLNRRRQVNTLLGRQSLLTILGRWLGLSSS